jgi:hypothetical protein
MGTSLTAQTTGFIATEALINEKFTFTMLLKIQWANPLK